MTQSGRGGKREGAGPPRKPEELKVHKKNVYIRLNYREESLLLDFKQALGKLREHPELFAKIEFYSKVDLI